MPGANRAAVAHRAGRFNRPIAIKQPGMFLSQPGGAAQGVVPLGFDDRFDRVGDQIARLQRIAHPFGAHRHAVANADRAESHPDQPRRDHALFTRVASLSRCILHGFPSYQLLTMPPDLVHVGLLVSPVAQQLACEPPCDFDCVIQELYLFKGLGISSSLGSQG